MKISQSFAMVMLMAGAATSQAAGQVDAKAVLLNYTEIAHAVFADSLISAQTLQQKVDQFVQSPSEKTLNEAKQAWIAARVPYQQSEVLRFGNAIVDDWEGQLNAWPLDEGLIDYVAADYEYELGNFAAQANIIANTQLRIGGEVVDTSHLTPQLLASLNEFAGSEANVATGYHAIEFLLWGQDLNGVKAGAGSRPYTDYVVGSSCSNGHCERRGAYLRAATELLIDDLQLMVGHWAPGQSDNYAAELRNGDVPQGLEIMLNGMGSLSLGELAGERLKVALEANSPEDEHDCFSDNTHYSHYYDGVGIQNIYQGRYERIDGSLVEGASLANLVAAKQPQLHIQVRIALKETEDSLQKLVDMAEGEPAMKFDQMIAEGNQAGAEAIQQAIAALVAQTQLFEKVSTLLTANTSS